MIARRWGSPAGMSDERMDEEQVRRTLGEALSLQARSLLEMSLLAGALKGLSGVGTKTLLRQLVQHEIEDTYLLTEKVAALGGTLMLDVDAVEVPAEPGPALAQLLTHEREVVAKLHEVIAHSGQEPRSEALEHLLEHVIMRKQQQADYLWHAADRDEPMTADPAA
jgi:Ferritin-like domain